MKVCKLAENTRILGFMAKCVGYVLKLEEVFILCGSFKLPSDESSHIFIGSFHYNYLILQEHRRVPTYHAVIPSQIR